MHRRVGLILLASGLAAAPAHAANIRVSVSSAGGDANGPSAKPSLSSDGNLVAFQSSAINLVGLGCTTTGVS